MMKRLYMFFFLMASLALTAQEDCQYTVMTAEGGQELKSTKEYLMYEKVFGTTTTFIFFSLTNSEGMPVLNFQLLSKSKDFIPANCLDKNSKIYLQLTNGKIITLINALEDNCSGLVYDSTENTNIRVLTSSFLFTKGSLEELENNSILFMRVKYATETVDYPINGEITSEIIEGKYFPENYFINTLKCIQ